MPKFVTAYSTATGRKQRVPEHFIGHPVLGRGLRLAPSQRAVDVDLTDLSDAWTVKQLKAYAAEHDIDLGEATRKADILAAIEAATTATPTTSDANQADDETPATGADEGAQ